MSLEEPPPEFQLLPRKCPICCSEDAEQVFAAQYNEHQFTATSFASRKLPEFMHFNLVCCKRCDLLYATPAPPAEVFHQLYVDAAYDSAEEADYAARTYARFLPKIKAHLRIRDKALDIGTGNGGFLRHLKEAGFSEVVGVEPSKAPVNTAPPEIQALIKNTIFSADDFESSSFSLISCFQTLEHVENPGELCGQIYDLLQEGGAVFFVAHNYRSWLARLLKTKSPIYDIEHLQLHSPHSLRYMLQQAGFQSIRVRPIINVYPLRYWLRLLPVSPTWKQHIIDWMSLVGIGHLPIPMPVGNSVAIGYKPAPSQRHITDGAKPTVSQTQVAEKNVSSFNQDVAENAGYVYTTNQQLSSLLSNARISEAVWAMESMKNKTVLDVGCGDGTYTQEFLQFQPKEVTGLDPAEEAIAQANKNTEEQSNIRFVVGDIYHLTALEQRFDIAVVRGVLHHLYDVRRAVAELCKVADTIIVVEPNGYNPVLKVIEKTSAYHIEHEEKSYPPHKLDQWFEAHGGMVVKSEYIGLVPFFCPDGFTRILKQLEPFVEKIYLFNRIACGQYVQKIRVLHK